MQGGLGERGDRHLHVAQQVDQVVEAGLDQGDGLAALLEVHAGDHRGDAGGVREEGALHRQRGGLAMQPEEGVQEPAFEVRLLFGLGLVPELREPGDDLLLRRGLALVGVGVGQVETGLQRFDLVLGQVDEGADICFFAERHEELRIESNLRVRRIGIPGVARITVGASGGVANNGRVTQLIITAMMRMGEK